VRKPLVVLATLAVMVALAGCGGSPDRARTAAGPSGDKALRVVATTTVVQDFTRIIGGDKIQLTGILKPNVDAHVYEPAPADINAIAKANVLVTNGVGLEKWLDDSINSAGFKGTIVDTSTGVQLIQGEGAEAEHGANPHIWHTPNNAKIMCTNIEQLLAAADPDNAAYYKANLNAYSTKLDTLDADIASQIDRLDNKKLVTNHDALAYYVARYHLEFIGSIIPSFDTSAELSAKDIADLVAKIKATGVKAIFSETSLPPKTAETIANEAHVKVVEGEDALYGDGLGPPGSDGATYLQMMAHNTKTIVSNLAST
jgi:ABC-type Zn uptake system ZnuABC Zn-binding protein ZnuA